MGIVGVYKPETTDDAHSAVVIKALHLNFWFLPKRSIGVVASPFVLDFSLHHCYLDVGLRIQLKGVCVDSIDLHLPCLDGQPVEMADLADLVLDESVNDLVFGRKVTSEDGRIRYIRNDLTIDERVVRLRCIEVIDPTERYRLRFCDAVDASAGDESVYLRFRYRCSVDSDVQVSKGWGFAKRGHLFDLRVNDVRETLTFAAKNKSDQMFSIDEVNAFLIHSSDYVRISESPSATYSRLLEPMAWSEYLRSCAPFRRKVKYVITQWKRNVVSNDDPMRVFAHLQREFGFILFCLYVLGASLPGLLVWAFQYWL
jgi:hypothetical protein